MNIQTQIASDEFADFLADQHVGSKSKSAKWPGKFQSWNRVSDGLLVLTVEDGVATIIQDNLGTRLQFEFTTGSRLKGSMPVAMSLYLADGTFLYKRDLKNDILDCTGKNHQYVSGFVQLAGDDFDIIQRVRWHLDPSGEFCG